MQKKLFGILLLLLFVVSCTKEKDEPWDVFSVSATTQAILDNCQNDPLILETSIEKLLIGNWRLYDYACSHCSPIPMPEASITFTEEGGTYRYEDIFEETSFDFTWKLAVGSSGDFILQTTPAHFGLNLTNFCQDFMFQDTRPLDGTLHLYQKQ